MEYYYLEVEVGVVGEQHGAVLEERHVRCKVGELREESGDHLVEWNGALRARDAVYDVEAETRVVVPPGAAAPPARRRGLGHREVDVDARQRGAVREAAALAADAAVLEALAEGAEVVDVEQKARRRVRRGLRVLRDRVSACRSTSGSGRRRPFGSQSPSRRRRPCRGRRPPTSGSTRACTCTRGASCGGPGSRAAGCSSPSHRRCSPPPPARGRGRGGAVPRAPSSPSRRSRTQGQRARC